ncbi:MAG: hypothetical protein KDC83_11375 [Flavobacteriales bacterium]|nr:hypothetical protein [Flavobacteriales bacterium]
MFKEFFLIEIKGALKQPMIYIFFLLFGFMTFMAVISDSVSVGGAIGNIYRNSPYTITTMTSILSIFGLLIAAAFFNNAALRDFNHQFHEILFSTPLKRSSYYFGRFFGALFLSTIPLLGVFAGIALGSVIGPLAGWVQADRIGPMYFTVFANNYLLFVLPNMFFAGAIIFAMANKWKNTIISFVGTLLILVGYIISGTFLSDLENETLAALLDPFGIRSYFVVSRYFTPAEKNTLAPAFEGVLLANRLIWVSLGLLITLVSYRFFSFKEKTSKAAKAISEHLKEKISFGKPTLTQVNFRDSWSVFFSFYKVGLISILKNTTFRILFIFAIILLISDLVGGFEYFGLKSFPVTYTMVDSIANSSAVFLLIVIVFFSGELVWRDRDYHINEVIDASPHISFHALLAKALTLVSLTVFMQFFFILIAVVYQLSMGFTRIELDVYILSYLLGAFPTLMVWSCVLIFIQVIINQKYVAYFVSILFMFVLTIIMAVLDIRSNMVQIASGPSIRYSDMNWFGPGATGAVWFNVYWVLFGILLLLLSGFLWNRGVRSGFMDRLRQLKLTFKGSFARVSVAVLALWLITAGFVYYNTEVLNTYLTKDEREAESVAYEKNFKKFEDVTHPKICAVTYYIDIFPSERRTDVSADVLITNTSEQSLDSIHFTIDQDWNQKIELPNATLSFEDKLGYQIYTLTTPLQKGDTILMKVKANYAARGFENQVQNTSVIKNGTFFNNFSVLPAFGYQERAEIADKNDRKKFGLPSKGRMPELHENCGDACMKNYLTKGTADWVMVETYISTSDDQIAVAPGSKLSEETIDGRRKYHYKVDHPSQNFYSFISADYQVATRQWKDVDLEVYYDAKHPENIDIMLDALEKSLDYYTKNFGPYYHKQARILEFPRYSTFAQAFPGTMPYSEGFGFIVDLEDEDNNVIEAVIAHEMAHQWWAHQEVAADVQGGTMLTESFAEYSSLMVMKSTSDPMKMTEFLKYDYNRYLGGRSTEREKELPLYKVENQTYIHYGKGSVIMYALQDYIGEDSVNAALREFLDSTKYRNPPYPTSLDFLGFLEPRVPDSLKYLIEDWFKQITLYDFRIKEAAYVKQNENKYIVSVSFDAVKYYADTLGNEIEQPLTEWVDVGAMDPENEKKLLFVKRIAVNQKEMNVEFTMDKKPGKIVIDPKRLLIERVIKDNGKTAEEKIKS